MQQEKSKIIHAAGRMWAWSRRKLCSNFTSHKICSNCCCSNLSAVTTQRKQSVLGFSAQIKHFHSSEPDFLPETQLWPSFQWVCVNVPLWILGFLCVLVLHHPLPPSLHLLRAGFLGAPTRWVRLNPVRYLGAAVNWSSVRMCVSEWKCVCAFQSVPVSALLLEKEHYKKIKKTPQKSYSMSGGECKVNIPQLEAAQCSTQSWIKSACSPSVSLPGLYSSLWFQTIFALLPNGETHEYRKIREKTLKWISQRMEHELEKCKACTRLLH